MGSSILTIAKPKLSRWLCPESSSLTRPRLHMRKSTREKSIDTLCSQLLMVKLMSRKSENSMLLMMTSWWISRKWMETKDCRFAVYDYEYTFLPEGTSEPQMKSKIFIMCWCPDDGPVRKKMLYSSSFDTLKKAYVGHKKAIQVNDESELDSACIEEQLRAVDRN